MQKPRNALFLWRIPHLMNPAGDFHKVKYASPASLHLAHGFSMLSGTALCFIGIILEQKTLILDTILFRKNIHRPTVNDDCGTVRVSKKIASVFSLRYNETVSDGSLKNGGISMAQNQYLLTNLLSENDEQVITSIMQHIQKDDRRPSIQQIAKENYISTTYIVKMCKRLGFDGYSELYYSLSRQLEHPETGNDGTVSSALKNLIDNYDPQQIDRFCQMLYRSRKQKMFTSGEGFSDLIVSYMVQRLSICGFLAYNHVHFFDFMLFQEDIGNDTAEQEPSIMFVVSQSGEAEPVVNDVRHARQNGYKIVLFTKRDDSTLARLSDITFVLDSAKQTLVGGIPNLFFGHVILAFEELIALYFYKRSSGELSESPLG